MNFGYVGCVAVREKDNWMEIRGIEADLNRLYLQLRVGHSSLYSVSLEYLFLVGKLCSGRIHIS
jgi:hypothetical protein